MILEKIRDIKHFQKKVDLIAKVIDKTNIREVTSKLDETKHKVCEVLIGDDTGTIYLTVWDEAISKIEIGKAYIFKNLFSSEFQKSMRLNIGRFGEFQETDAQIDVDLENFRSQV
jgi:replication factor A1